MTPKMDQNGVILEVPGAILSPSCQIAHLPWIGTWALRPYPWEVPDHQYDTTGHQKVTKWVRKGVKMG